MRKKKILGISGSTKSSSTSLSILEFLAEEHKEKLELFIYDRINDLPHFNPELEEDLPSKVEELRQKIEDADGVIFCTPEYVYSLPGSLKNLIEWQVSTVLFSNKPVAMIIAAASGKKAYESLDLILSTLEVSMPDESKLLIQGAKGKLSSTGMISDQDAIDKLNGVIKSIIKTINNERKSAI